MRTPYVLVAIASAFALFSASTAQAQPCPKNTPRDKQGRPLNKNCEQQRPGPVFFPGFGAFGGGGGGGGPGLAESPGSSRHGTLGKSGKSSGGPSGAPRGGSGGGSGGGGSGGGGKRR
jgi:hypothetical protein